MTTFPRYTEYKDSGVEWLGEVPAHWEPLRLKQVVSPDRPITYGIVQAGENVDDGVPYIRPADMFEEDGVRSLEGLLKTSLDIAKSYSRSSLASGDLVCSIGPSFGKLMVVPKELRGANLTQGTARVAIEKSHHSRYYFWALRSPESFNQWESSIGGATFRALNLGPLSDTRVLAPPRAEQRYIASFLDYETTRIDALIDEQERLIELLKEKRQAVISHAVTKGLDPDVPMKDSVVEWLGEVPVHWEVVPLKYLAIEKVAGPYGASLTKSMYTTSGYRVYGQQQVIPNDFSLGEYYISQAKFEEMVRYQVYPGDVLFSVMGTVGKVAVVPPEVESGVINPRLVRYRFCREVNPDFIRLLVMSLNYQRSLQESAQGSTMEGLNMSILGELPILLPGLEEQGEIATWLTKENSRLEELVRQAKHAMELLNERRSALISAAVTGKIDVRNWQHDQSTEQPELAMVAEEHATYR